jgi:hypothetical protein
MNFLNNSKTKPIVWIDFINYANRLFAAGRNNLWSNEDTFISVYSQGQSLLKSDILSIPIHNFFQTWLSGNMDLLQIYAAKKTTFVLKKILAAEEPKRVIKSVLSGFENLYNGSKPVALVVPSPQLWLAWLDSIMCPQQAPSFGENEIEAAAMYLAEYLRDYSTSGLSSIVLEETENSPVDGTGIGSLYKPMINIARHYQWSTGLLIDGTLNKELKYDDEIDFYLIKGSDLPVLDPLLNKKDSIGIGLNEQFWSGQPINHETTNFVYGAIPENADPETVLSQLMLIRSR